MRRFEVTVIMTIDAYDDSEAYYKAEKVMEHIPFDFSPRAYEISEVDEDKVRLG